MLLITTEDHFGGLMAFLVMFGLIFQISMIYTFFYIISSIEYITTLTITSGNDHHYAPTHIIIEGCSGMNCIVLGKQDNIVWNGAYETHSMIVNEGKQSYSIFHILFGRLLFILLIQ